MSEIVLSPGAPIKLVIWDLDDALWSGADDADAAPLHRDTRALFAALDDRGVLQSAVARSGTAAWRALEQRGLADYVLCPQLAADDQPAAVREIARGLNLALDATLVIGGELAGSPGQRDDATGAEPVIGRVGAAAISRLIGDPRIGPSLVGIEPRPRRLIYREELARAAAERAFLAAAALAAAPAGRPGPLPGLAGAAAPGGASVAAPDGFLATLAPRLTIAPAGAGDLPRLRELVNRANQRCATYSDDELARLCSAPDSAALLISLSDRFGDSGPVGAVVIERAAERWTVQLLQLSCRAQGRGIPDLVVGWILREARAAGVALVTEVVPTSKNQALLAMYQRAGFAETLRRGDTIVLAADPARAPAAPPWLTVIAPSTTARGAALPC